jgi:hypothetical protein
MLVLNKALECGFSVAARALTKYCLQTICRLLACFIMYAALVDAVVFGGDYFARFLDTSQYVRIASLT